MRETCNFVDQLFIYNIAHLIFPFRFVAENFFTVLRKASVSPMENHPSMNFRTTLRAILKSSVNISTCRPISNPSLDWNDPLLNYDWYQFQLVDFHLPILILVSRTWSAAIKIKRLNAMILLERKRRLTKHDRLPHIQMHKYEEICWNRNLEFGSCYVENRLSVYWEFVPNSKSTQSAK